MAAYLDISEAVVQLREVRTSSVGPAWQGRAANATAARAARELVASAHARLAALAPMDARQRGSLERIRGRLLESAQRFGRDEPVVDPNQEALAPRELEEVLRQLRELILADPWGRARRAQIDACDQERAQKGQSQSMRVHQRNPFVWLGLMMFLLIAARMLLAR